MDTAMEQAARKNRTTRDYERCLDELIGAALALDSGDVDEYDVLCRIIVKADAGWRCPSCRGINYHSDCKCNNCRAKKPKAREVPQYERRFWETNKGE